MRCLCKHKSNETRGDKQNPELKIPAQTLVRDHIFKMEYFCEFESAGGEMDGQSHVDFVLGSLP